MGRRKGLGEMPEHAMHGHQVFRRAGLPDIPDTGPLGVPAVGAVIGETRLRKPVVTPALVRLAYRQDDGTVVPAQRPDRVRCRIRIAVNAAGAGHFGELIATHQGPVLSIPFHQGAGRDIEALLGQFAFFPVVGVHRHALTGIKALAVITREQGAQVAGEAFLPLLVAVLIQFHRFEAVDIHIIEAGLHRGQQDAVAGVRQMPGKAGMTAGIAVQRNHPDVLVRIHGIGADEELLGFPVDHPVGVGAAYAFRTDDFFQPGRNLIEFVIRPEGLVRRIGHHPEVALPRHDGSGPAFPLGIVIRQMRIDSAVILMPGRLFSHGSFRAASGKGEQERQDGSQTGKVHHRFETLIVAA